MYCFVFAAAIKNRWVLKVGSDGFEMSKGLTVIASALGIISCLLGYILSFHKPDFLNDLSSSQYHQYLLIATAVYIVVPIYFIIKRKKVNE
jgi:hypothetical protein